MVAPAVVVSPIVAVLDQADLPPLDADDRAGAAGMALSLVDAFERVPDPRQARGIRHDLVPLLVVAACAVMTGARSFAAIGEYARDKGRLARPLDVDGDVAHPATIRRVLVEIDPAGLQEAITAWSLAQLDTQDRPSAAPPGTPVRELRPVIAVDGKTCAAPGRERATTRATSRIWWPRWTSTPGRWNPTSRQAPRARRVSRRGSATRGRRPPAPPTSPRDERCRCAPRPVGARCGRPRSRRRSVPLPARTRSGRRRAGSPPAWR